MNDRLSDTEPERDGVDPDLVRKLRRNLPATLSLSFFQVFTFLMPVIVIFFETRGLSLSEVLLLQAWFGVLLLVCEVPSGYIADMLGRRGAIIVGALFLGMGQTVVVFAHGFWQLAVFEGCLAIGMALISGADLALLYDTELVLERGNDSSGRQKAVRRIFIARNLSEALSAIGTSVLLVFVTLNEIVVAQAFFGWLPLVIAFLLVEPPRERMASGDHRGNLARILREVLVDDRVLRLVFLALSVWALTTMYAAWLTQSFWREEGIELVYFGYIWGALSLIAAIAGQYAQKIEERIGTPATLLLMGVGPVAGYLAYGLLGVASAIAVSSLFYVCRGVGLVVLRDALNRRVSSEYRATANSLASFGFRAAFALTAPVVGAALDLWGLNTTLLLLAAASAAISVAILVPLMFAARGASAVEAVEV